MNQTQKEMVTLAIIAALVMGFLFGKVTSPSIADGVCQWRKLEGPAGQIWSCGCEKPKDGA